MIKHVALAILALTSLSIGQTTSDTQANTPNPFTRGAQQVFNYLNMADVKTADDFVPLTQHERTHIYLRTMVNPIGFAKAAFSAGIDQWNDKPVEWEQGASGYGKRFGNILGQYSTQRTATFGLSSWLHEDNRYFNSGKSGFWSRTAYALSSGVLARHDDGSRHISISQIGGTAAGSFLARAWLPPSVRSAGDAATDFGVSMSANIGFGVAKEFLPDVLRALKRKPPAQTASSQ